MGKLQWLGASQSWQENDCAARGLGRRKRRPADPIAVLINLPALGYSRHGLLVEHVRKGDPAWTGLVIRADHRMKLPRAILFDLDDTILVAFAQSQSQWQRTIAAFADQLAPI